MDLPQAKFAYTLPEQTRKVDGVFRSRKDENGDPIAAVERIPNHPKRPAYAHEVNVWWEDVTADEAQALIQAGATVRFAASLSR